MKLAFNCTLVLLVSLTANVASARVSRTEYDARIREARLGNYEPALIMLRQHGAEYPRDLRAAYDHILIASWAKKSDEAIAAYEMLQPAPNRMPADVLSAVAQAYRDTQRWDAALDQYRHGRLRYPRNAAFTVGEIMVLADAGQAEDAIRLGKEQVDKHPGQTDLRLALAYAYKSSGFPYAALQEADQARSLAPQKKYVNREYVESLQHAGIPLAALGVAKQNPGLLNAKEIRNLEADYAAELSRLADLPARQESERFVIADRALAEYDRLIPAWEALGPEARPELLRIRADRLQALHTRMRMQDVVDGYNALLAEGIDVPRYVLNDVAAAYLYLRQPEIAAKLYQQTLDYGSKMDSPGERLANETGLFYSLIESEQFDDSVQVIEQARAEQPTWRRIKGVNMKIPNDLHLYSEQTAALGEFYVDNTPAAQSKLEEMVSLAPGNVGLHVALANVYRGRAQPRKAEKQLKMAEALEPRAVEIEAGQGITAMDLQEWRQANTLALDLAVRFPEEKSTDNLARRWATHNKAELKVTGNRGIASDSPVIGSGDFDIDTVLYSAPLNYNWRVFGGGGYAEGDFEEGKGHYRWLRTGVEWRGRDLTAELEASTNNYGYGTKPGARASVAYDLNDHWQVGGGAAFRSRETPLRALRSDISSNSLGAFVRWRANDFREWTFSLSPSRFSDGNKRLATYISGRERVYTSPKLKADLQLNISASHNSLEDVPYFNPRADLEILPTLNLTHTLYRHYETSWEQNFLLGAGLYAQRGYGSGAIGALGYGMRYHYNNQFDIGGTVIGTSRPYDGVREREVRIMFEMNFRF
ncbi:poly-beta-1,6 N-acetyl-D-glucosamine export porin PgaA [Pollutimonas bauzanensis]|uniref:poly-beta-1,6 N-acetyl-D-glucosamine export porin PgaA n=1 Tax=Pollutimonas bauzanensis TaxID=658167 RepID=UPI00333FF045